VAPDTSRRSLRGLVEVTARALFISHQASRTGAPIVLLHFLRWLAANSRLRFEVLLAEDGELRSEFADVAPTSVLDPWEDDASVAVLLARVRRRWTLSRLAKRPWDVVYTNTITNGAILRALAGRTPPAICHVHELDTAIRHFGQSNLDDVRRHTRKYVACSHVVRNNLVDNYGIDRSAVDVVHECIPIPPDSLSADVEARRRVCGELGIPADALIVGAAGTTDWRKGSDLFVHIARTMRYHRPDLPTHFIWVGGRGPGTDRFAQLQHDLRTLGLQSVVHFLGQRDNPLDYFRAFDVFALTSREDPFPLVCLEVASVGKPIVCFDGAGGEKEFVEDDCGFVVPYLDLDGMAARLVTLLEDGDRRRLFGRAAAAKVRLRHDVERIAPRLLAIIEEQLAGGAPNRAALTAVQRSSRPDMFGGAVKPS
jgi:glycosyltransferase involved in cell wall biosynthesis